MNSQSDEDLFSSTACLPACLSVFLLSLVAFFLDVSYLFSSLYHSHSLVLVFSPFAHCFYLHICYFGNGNLLIQVCFHQNSVSSRITQCVCDGVLLKNIKIKVKRNPFIVAFIFVEHVSSSDQKFSSFSVSLALI